MPQGNGDAEAVGARDQFFGPFRFRGNSQDLDLSVRPVEHAFQVIAIGFADGGGVVGADRAGLVGNERPFEVQTEHAAFEVRVFHGPGQHGEVAAVNLFMTGDDGGEKARRAVFVQGFGGTDEIFFRQRRIGIVHIDIAVYLQIDETRNFHFLPLLKISGIFVK